MYEVIESEIGGIVISRQNQDGTISFIPQDESNSDYQRYLRWLNGEDEDGTLS